MKNIRVAIISFEHMHAFSYAHAFSNTAGAELVAVCESDPERMKKVRADFPNVPAYFEDYRKMLAEVECDAVIITSRNSDHPEIAVECARHGKHILCEKPIAVNIPDAQRIIAEARKANVKLMTAFPVRFSPAIAEAKRMIQGGVTGQILGACTSNHGSMPGGWFVEKDKSGGGAVMDHTVHVADLLRWMLEDEVAEVYAEYANRLHPIDVEDVGQLLMRFRKGAVVSLDTSWSRCKSYSIWGDVKMEIKGEKGNISINCFPRQINHYDDRTMRHSATNAGEDLDALMIAEFLSAIREDREPCVSGEDGMRAVEVALAAYEAGEKGKVVKLELAAA